MVYRIVNDFYFIGGLSCNISINATALLCVMILLPASSLIHWLLYPDIVYFDGTR